MVDINVTEDAAAIIPVYRYNAIIEKVVDGDTIVVSLDLGFGIWLHKQSIRLYGINTPEIKGGERERGLLAKRFVVSRLVSYTSKSISVVIDTFKGRKDKYGRWLGKVWYFDSCNCPHLLNEELVVNDMAVRYMED